MSACGDDAATAKPLTDQDQQTEEPAELSYPLAIECGVLYRPVVASAAGAEKGELSIPRADGLVSEPERRQFGAFTLSGTYTGDAPDSSNSVVLQVAHGSSHVWTGRFAVPADSAHGSQNHGFTGLQYIEYDGAELQVWCRPNG